MSDSVPHIEATGWRFVRVDGGGLGRHASSPSCTVTHVCEGILRIARCPLSWDECEVRVRVRARVRMRVRVRVRVRVKGGGCRKCDTQSCISSRVDW